MDLNMDLLVLFKFYTTSVIALLGVLIMLSPLILEIYRKKEKNNGPKDLSMLFNFDYFSVCLFFFLKNGHILNRK
ncbi:hypothetical protein A6E11_12545 [Aliivibrio fischeri]|nr:hypothetical protein A6E11_12545 [Aliivibrio fischeri]OCH59383.1 hypothetical protein A6D98_13480 [Aliivibrio fischeri]